MDTETRPRRARIVPLLFVIAAVVIVVDQFTKALVASKLADGESRRVLGGVLSWTLQRNPGSAFGLFQHFPVLFTALAAVIALAIIVLANRVQDRFVAVALGLVLGGALGNLVDRVVRPPGIFRGRVVDFIDFHVWPVFNVADSAVVVGAILLFIASYVSERRAAQRRQREHAAA
ncbi:MAG: signal peptidase II [Actinomycetota bacterium]